MQPTAASLLPQGLDIPDPTPSSDNSGPLSAVSKALVRRLVEQHSHCSPSNHQSSHVSLPPIKTLKIDA